MSGKEPEQEKFSAVRHWLIKARGIGAYEIAVYSVLAMYADNDGYCYPSVATIAAHLECSVRQVKKVLGILAELKIVHILPRYGKDGSQTSNLYRIEKYPEKTGLAECGDGTQSGDGEEQGETTLPPVHIVHTPRAHSAGTPCTLCTPPVHIVHTNYNQLTKTNRTNINPLSPLNGNPGKNENTETLFEQWWKLYPRKTGKQPARKAFEKALRKTDIETLCERTAEYAATAAKTGAVLRFIPYPGTWLNREGWADDFAQVFGCDGGAPGHLSRSQQAAWRDMMLAERLERETRQMRAIGDRASLGGSF